MNTLKAAPRLGNCSWLIFPPPLPFPLQTLLWLMERERWRGSEQQQALLGRGMETCWGWRPRGRTWQHASIPGSIPKRTGADPYQQTGFELTFLLTGDQDEPCGKWWQPGRSRQEAWKGEPTACSLLCHCFPAWLWGCPCVFDTITLMGIP